MSLLLSQYMGVGSERVTPILESKQRIQTISVVVDAITQYSASVDEQDTISCVTE